MRFKLFHDGNINYLMIINNSEKTYLITDIELIIEVFRSKKVVDNVDIITKENVYYIVKKLKELGYERIM